jgi:thiol-disulfide isomerase/thioredoxin
MKNFIYIVIGFFLIRCERKPLIEIGNTPKKPGVTLIFEYIQENSRYEFSNGISTNNGDIEIQYIDDNLIPKFISPNQELIDTFRILSNRSIIEIQHAYRSIDKLSILLLNGDTAIFRYENKRPHVTIINRKSKSIDTNYEIIMRDLICNGDFPSIIKYQTPFAFIRRDSTIKNIAKVYNDTGAIYKIRAFNELSKEKRLLDSLQVLKEMSALVLSVATHQNRYDSILFAEKFNSSIGFPRKYLAEDSLLYYGFYNDFLDAIIYQYYSKKVGIIKSENNLNPDFTAIYDSIRQSNLFSYQTKVILLRKTLNTIFESQSTEVISRYLKDFTAYEKDSIQSAYLKSKWRFDHLKSKNLVLTGIKGNSLSYDDLLLSHKGNIIYVDFWASWCGPCIQQFPSSGKLKDALAGRDISFIYISIDTDSVKWRRASHKHKLDNSYLVDNRYSLRLTEELKIISIPRYLIYDRNGRLAHNNAPRPDNKELVELLRRFLNE